MKKFQNIFHPPQQKRRIEEILYSLSKTIIISIKIWPIFTSNGQLGICFYVQFDLSRPLTSTYGRSFVPISNCRSDRWLQNFWFRDLIVVRRLMLTSLAPLVQAFPLFSFKCIEIYVFSGREHIHSASQKKTHAKKHGMMSRLRVANNHEYTRNWTKTLHEHELL